MIAFALQAFGTTGGRGDIHAAIELCKLIADIEPTGRSDCYWMPVFRRDTPKELIRQCVSALEEKFLARAYIARDFATGHPGGSNALWLSTLMEAEGQYRDSLKNKKLPQFNGVLTFESDCIPLRRDWISALTNEWNQKVIGAGEWTEEEEDPLQWHTLNWPKYEIMAHWDHDHYNGNMVLRPDIRQRHSKVINFTSDLGWDYCQKDLYKRIGCDTDMILQHYRRGTITREEIPFLTK